jgi:hypothetical protein
MIQTNTIKSGTSFKRGLMWGWCTALVGTVIVGTVIGIFTVCTEHFYCDSVAEERFCTKFSRPNSFLRKEAYCYTSSFSSSKGWSDYEVINTCFPSLEECNTHRQGRGTGSLGQPPVKSDCRLTYPNEHSDKIRTRF